MLCRFGTIDHSNQLRAISFTVLSIVTIACSLYLANSLLICSQRIHSNANANRTSSTLRLSYPYEPCLCPSHANQTDSPSSPSPCLRWLEMELLRFFLVTSYLLQLFGLREYFTLEWNSSSFVFIRLARPLVASLFIVLAVGLFWNGSLQVLFLLLIYSTATFLVICCLYDVLTKIIHDDFSSSSSSSSVPL